MAACPNVMLQAESKLRLLALSSVKRKRRVCSSVDLILIAVFNSNWCEPGNKLTAFHIFCIGLF